jgi:hypothetical protein
MQRAARLCEMTWFMTSGSKEGIKRKTLHAKVLGGSQKLCELYQLFSSFLRGASCPKSPRDAAFAAASFMQEGELVVKVKVIFTKTFTTKRT